MAHGEGRGSHRLFMFLVCSAYNAMNGVPTCGDPNLLNGILRGRWNFTGFVVSDYDAWANIVTTHHECPDMECAAAVGINAGMGQSVQ
jgi:beta-glucosidase-like glycosyl hydrolase